MQVIRKATSFSRLEAGYCYPPTVCQRCAGRSGRSAVLKIAGAVPFAWLWVSKVRATPLVRECLTTRMRALMSVCAAGELVKNCDACSYTVHRDCPPSSINELSGTWKSLLLIYSHCFKSFSWI